ncbi:carbohydrate esterase family 9 protein [Lentinula detonsa]|uniref:Carbohydrate esterase family 9 protein n=1 Tax=Lentinula detonsa TaxID=2804962 RepID=A0A9W8P2F5_9AGAR|nr:carbohydrate esterase family 9 protein [Lentinula detonsa]
MSDGRNRQLLVVLLLALLLGFPLIRLRLLGTHTTSFSPVNRTPPFDKCRSLKLPAGPPPTFHERSESDRFVPGTPPTLIRNATIWTGAYNRTEVIYGDILLDKGMIINIGRIQPILLQTYGAELVVFDARRRWVTPGIVDLHSHMGNSPSPDLSGSVDVNSFKGIAQPWLRSVDGINTHDDSYQLSVAGGLTAALILPGSANAIATTSTDSNLIRIVGGQAYIIKLRKTAERSTSSMILEPPYQMNSSSSDLSSPPRWRHIKRTTWLTFLLVGENPSRVYNGTRMDTMWAFRQAYNEATKLKQKQDEFCAKLEAGQSEILDGQGEFPDDLRWEALVDVLRGRVKVNTHCYEAVDLDAFVRLSNEFKFPLAAFHHAHETYLVPDVLKRAYGGPPVSAIFSGFSRYKRESYHFSEFAAKILTENGLTVVMKSDHSAINSRYLLHEAQQAYYHGLPENVAFASVTSNPADAMALALLRSHHATSEGWDADLAIWDSHPLALGATPVQVYIDGIAQLENPAVAKKPDELQRAPKIPNYDEEARKAVEYDGLPPLSPTESSSELVIFTNVKQVFIKSSMRVVRDFFVHDEDALGELIASKGKPICWGSHGTCSFIVGSRTSKPTIVDLQGGSVSPALSYYGSPLGLQHITLEPSTTDGEIFDPLSSDVPSILGNGALIRAADGLQYGSRDALMAYRSGVTTAITAPEHGQCFFGLGTYFSTGASHKLELGALPQEITALHTAVTYNAASSVSIQIAVLRRLFLSASEDTSPLGTAIKKVATGQMPLVVEVGNADAIATLIMLKREIEAVYGNTVRLTIAGAAESHLLSKELRDANVGVIVGPVHPFPHSWDIRRILPGPPLSKDSVISKLLDHKITVGISPVGLSRFVPPGNWNAQNLRLYAAWTALDSDGRINKEQALSMASVNLEKLLGASAQAENTDFVATVGGDLLDPTSQVVAILSQRSERVDIF